MVSIPEPGAEEPGSDAPMHFVYYDNYKPRSWLSDGKMRGILIDIINEAAHKRSGIDIIQEGFPWKRAQLMVQNGMADAFITLPTPERSAYTLVSRESVI